MVIVKLKGSSPLIFHVKIEKQVKRKGVVSLLRGFRAAHKKFMINVIKELEGLADEKCLIKKGNKKGIIKSIQLSWLKLDVPGSKIFNTCVIIVYIYLKIIVFFE